MTICFCQSPAWAQTDDTLNIVDFNKGTQPKPGTVVVNMDYKKVLGNWVSADRNTQLTLVLEKNIISMGNPPFYFQAVKGGYKLIRNNKEIANTLNTYPVSNRVNPNKDEIKLAVTNSDNHKETIFTAKLIDKNTLLINLNKQQGEGTIKTQSSTFLTILNLKGNRII